MTEEELAALAAQQAADTAAAQAIADAAAAAKAAEASKGKLTDREAELLREVMDKKTKLQNTTTELQKASDRLKLFDGLDPTEVQALVAAAKVAKEKELEAKGQWDALRAQIVAEHSKILDEQQAKLTGAEAKAAAAAEKIAELTVGSAFGQSKFVTEKIALPVSKLRSLYGAHFEFDGEKVIGYDKPAGAKNRVELVDAKGIALPFDAAMEKLIEADPDRDHLLKATIRTGAGSGTEKNRGAAGPAGNTKPAPVNGRDMIANGLNAQSKK